MMLMSTHNIVSPYIIGKRWGAIVPCSGKVSPGKNFAKARANVLQKKFGRFIFAQPGLGEIKFQRNLYLTPCIVSMPCRSVMSV